MAMIVASSNFASETYCEKVVHRHVHPFIAHIYCNALNQTVDDYSETYYKIRPDDYLPWRGMFDLVGDHYPGTD